MITTAILVCAIILLTLGSGLCSASEAALFSLSTPKLKSYKSSDNPRQQLIADLLKHPRNLLVTIFLLNTIVNILLQNVVSHTFMKTGGWLAAVGLPFILLLLFGEIIPKYIGIQNNERLSMATVPLINFSHRILYFLRTGIVYILAPVSQIFAMFLKKNPEISRDELHYVLKESEEAGILSVEERELIGGSLNLQDSTVREIMRPREDILSYDVQDPITKLVHLFVDKQCSRIPVIDKELDNVLGIIDAKQYFVYRNLIKEPANLMNFLWKPFYIPETTPARTLLRKLDENGQELALAVDEYGSVTGLIAYEDIVEVVVGEISDPRDDKAIYTKAGQHEIIASGKMELTEFNDLFHAHLKSESMVTLGGWLIEQMGDIPKSGSAFETEHFLFQVLSADPNRIRRIYVRKRLQK